MATDPVFPREAKYSSEWGTIQRAAAAGLTKRDLFAAMAMQGMMAAETAADDFVASGVAKRAVIYADALLAELAKVTS